MLVYQVESRCITTFQVNRQAKFICFPVVHREMREEKRRASAGTTVHRLSIRSVWIVRHISNPNHMYAITVSSHSVEEMQAR